MGVPDRVGDADAVGAHADVAGPVSGAGNGAVVPDSATTSTNPEIDTSAQQQQLSASLTEVW